jgi:putative transcriptional regulator
MKNRVKAEREFKEMTQEQLAQLVGVSRQTIHAIEHDRFIPSTLLALKLSKVFKRKVNDLFYLEEFDWEIPAQTNTDKKK